MAYVEKRDVPKLPGPLFKLLAEQEEGRLRPLAIQRAVMDIRARQVQLSSLREIMPPHGSEVACMSVDAVEDRYLLCGHANGALAILDVEESQSSQHRTFECVVRLVRGDAHEFSVTGVGWYPRDTGMFVTGSFDKSVRVWDTNNAKVVYAFTMSEKVFDVNLPQNAVNHSLVAVACGDGRACLCDLNSGARQHTLAGHRGAVTCLAWSSTDEFVLATGGQDGTLRVWDIRRTASCVAMLSKDEAPQLNRGKRSREFLRGVEEPEGGGGAAARRNYAPLAHTGGVSAVIYSPDGRNLLTSGVDGHMRLWNPVSYELEVANFGKFPQDESTFYKKVQLAVSWQSRLVFHPRRRDVIVADLQSGERLATLPGHMDTVQCCVAQPRGETIFSGGKDANILAWTPPSTGWGGAESDGEGDEDAWSEDEA